MIVQSSLKIHAKLRHIIESNSSEEGVSSCSSVAGDEIHDPVVPGSFSWTRSEGEPAGYWFLRESR